MACLVEARTDGDHTADHSRIADYRGHLVLVDAVLGGDQDAGRGEIRLDERGGPHAVVGLHREDHGIEPLAQGAHVCQVKGLDLDRELLVLGGDLQAAAPHLLDVGGPQIDERDVAARAGEIAADRAPDGPRPEYRQLLEWHGLSHSGSFTVTVRKIL